MRAEHASVEEDLRPVERCYGADSVEDATVLADAGQPCCQEEILIPLLWGVSQFWDEQLTARKGFWYLAYLVDLFHQGFGSVQALCPFILSHGEFSYA